MSETSQTPLNVLRSWIAIEVLTPQVSKNGWNALAAEHGGQQKHRRNGRQIDVPLWVQPTDHETPPWILRPKRASFSTTGDKPEEAASAKQGRPRDWYRVYLGGMPAGASVEALDSIFKDSTDEDRVARTVDGVIVAASIILDDTGVFVPKSLNIASFAWGLGKLLSGSTAAKLSNWPGAEHDLNGVISDKLSVTDGEGRPRSLTWQDLRVIGDMLRDDLGLPAELWESIPATIATRQKTAPTGDILSSFFLPDLCQVLRGVSDLPPAASAYLGCTPPDAPWDALSDRERLADVLLPSRFPPGRWPGPGLHPLTLLQQAAVNSVVKDLCTEGLAAVNGPPGTGKTTLLRDIVAHVLLRRAEALVKIEKPWEGFGDLDLMDFAMVVASSNNAAVENISLELPIRKKALDEKIWRKQGLDYLSPTATALLKRPHDAPEEEQAWGLVAARLGNAQNRKDFFETFWWDPEVGLDHWLDRLWVPGRHDAGEPTVLSTAYPPPSRRDAAAAWHRAREGFQRAADRCRQLMETLSAINEKLPELQNLRDQLAAIRARQAESQSALDGVREALQAAQEQEQVARDNETAEVSHVSALRSVKPPFFARIFRTAAWKAYAADLKEQLDRLSEAKRATRAAKQTLAEETANETRLVRQMESAERELNRVEAEAAPLERAFAEAQRISGDNVPDPAFWDQSDDSFQRRSPWNGGEFRDARDALFVAAVELHRAFLVAGVRHIKPSLKKIVDSVSGKSLKEPVTAHDWGVFFLVVPVVSTTFASFGRMFRDFGAGSMGWLLIDEAGQAAPQQGMGALWRARRAVVIGDPLQIEPVATMPNQTTRLIFRSHDLDPEPWAAPQDSVQTLADRASCIQGHFPVEGGDPDDVRITGMPLLVHRRCEAPMFDLANRIAYADRMVHATSESVSPVRDMLGSSCWVDVDADSADKWVEAEGRLIARAIAVLCENLEELPDLYVICPFKAPARKLRHLLFETPSVLPDLPSGEREAWIRQRVGTVHTFQGKEAEAVIVMLGAGRGASPGARNWAGGTPNLLNVAATRAKRCLYIVGNRSEWRGAGVFSVAARSLDVRNADEWVPQRKKAVAQAFPSEEQEALPARRC